jgi:hypothetical protein
LTDKNFCVRLRVYAVAGPSYVLRSVLIKVMLSANVIRTSAAARCPTVAEPEQLFGGLGHGRLVGRGDTEHLHDRQHRQPGRAGLDEVDLAHADEVMRRC